MIKILLEIEEENNKKYKDFTATELNINVVEKQINATKGELKGSNLLKEKIGLKSKVQVINECKNKDVANILNEIFSI